jgi:AraC-like DNA-binding protein
MLRYLVHGHRDFDDVPDFIASRHCWEFYVVMEGTVKLACPDRKVRPEVFSNCICLVRPNRPYHWIAVSNPVRRIAVHFSHIPPLLENRLGDRDFLFQPVDEPHQKMIEDLVDLLMPHYLRPTELLEVYADKALLELSLFFLRDMEHPLIRPLHRIHHERVRKAEEWYKIHVAARPTVDHVAKEVGVSTSQLRRDFHEVYAIAPQQIFRRLRLHEAIRLMLNSDLGIDEVSRLSGFNSRVDFHRSFKMAYNSSPHQWRMSISAPAKDS